MDIVGIARQPTRLCSLSKRQKEGHGPNQSYFSLLKENSLEARPGSNLSLFICLFLFNLLICIPPHSKQVIVVTQLM